MGTLQRACFYALGATSFLVASCAPKPQPRAFPASVTGSSEYPKPAKIPGVSSPSTTPAPTRQIPDAPNPQSQKPANAAPPQSLPRTDASPPAKAAEISQYVTKGIPTEESPSVILFRSKSADPSSTPALFEDAIILNRVRTALKAASPDFSHIAGAARVGSGIITLELPPEWPARQAAAAIDTVLGTEGVQGVKAHRTL